ncbi:MAG: oxidative damage protection protein [Gammaproteobacteria bacterium]|nr:oxidative damage protection protein [Gammaproteobacteria bacterium]
MTRTVQCVKLGIEAEGLEKAPYPGEMGLKIFNEVSKQAWQMWIERQTMLMNENRLSPIDPKAKQFLKDEMDKFLFTGEEGAAIDGYVAPK